MSTYSTERSHWLGAPIIELDRTAFERSLLRRFSMAGEPALAYVERVAEQQLSKAQAILPFNAIVFGVIMLSEVRGAFPRLSMIGGLLVIVSCLCALAVMHAPWAAPSAYGDATADFRRACETVYSRAWKLAFALAGSAIGTLVLALPLLRQLVP